MPGALSGKVALVTGASQGIGLAIARALIAEAVQTLMIARTRTTLERAAADAGGIACVADVADDAARGRLVAEAQTRFDRLDILVHCAGLYRVGRIPDAPLSDLDALYRANLRGPYALTQALLPALVAARGQVVFVNSSITRAANTAGRAQFAAMQAALKAVADGLRDEVNEAGVRVISLFPGTTATPRTASIQGDAYRPDRLLQPDDVARTVRDALMMAPTAEVTDIYVRQMFKSPS